MRTWPRTETLISKDVRSSACALVCTAMIIAIGIVSSTAAAQSDLICGFVEQPDTTSLATLVQDGIGWEGPDGEAARSAGAVDTIVVKLIHVTFPEVSFGPPSHDLPSTMDVLRSTAFPQRSP